MKKIILWAVVFMMVAVGLIACGGGGGGSSGGGTPPQASYGIGGYYKTPLEDALPVEMQIKDEQRRPSLGLVFIIDHSGSMGETTVASARPPWRRTAWAKSSRSAGSRVDQSASCNWPSTRRRGVIRRAAEATPR